MAMRSGSCTSCGLMSFMSSSAASVQPPISRTVSRGQALRLVTQGCRITLDSVMRSRGFCRQMHLIRLSAVVCLLQQWSSACLHHETKVAITLLTVIADCFHSA